MVTKSTLSESPPEAPVSDSPPLLVRIRERITLRRIFFAIITIVLLWMVLVPVLFAIFGSVNTGFLGAPGRLSLGEYEQVLSGAGTYLLLLRSIEFAVGATVIAFILGAVVAWFVFRTDIPGRGVLGFLALFPAFMPAIIEVIAWKLLLDPTGGLLSDILISLHLPFFVFNVNSMPGMIFVGGIIQMPLVYLWLWPALLAMDPSLEEAASMTGSGRFRVVRTITLPLLLPALAATFLINLIVILGDIVVPSVIGLPARITVLATNIFLAFNNVPANVEEACVYGVILLVLTVFLTILYRRITSHGERYAVVRGRGYRPVVIRLGRARWPCSILLHLVLIYVVVLPIFVLLWTSLSPYLQVPSWNGIRHLTFEWYSSLLGQPGVVRGLANTVVLGIATAVTVAVMAVVIGWMIVRTKGRGRGLLDVLSFSPVAIPGLVLGLSLLWLYASLPIPVYGTLVILWIAFVTRFVPYGVRLVTSAIKQVHIELEEAAYVSGSTWGRAMKTVTLPLIAPTVVVAGIYTVLSVFQELNSSLLLSTLGTEPYSVAAYNLWEGGETGTTAAYGVLGVIIVSILVVGIQRFMRRPMELL